MHSRHLLALHGHGLMLSGAIGDDSQKEACLSQ